MTSPMGSKGDNPNQEKKSLCRPSDSSGTQSERPPYGMAPSTRAIRRRIRKCLEDSSLAASDCETRSPLRLSASPHSYPNLPSFCPSLPLFIIIIITTTNQSWDELLCVG